MQNTILDTCNLLFDLIPLMLVFFHILKISKIIYNMVVKHIPDIFLNQFPPNVRFWQPAYQLKLIYCTIWIEEICFQLTVSDYKLWQLQLSHEKGLQQYPTINIYKAIYLWRANITKWWNKSCQTVQVQVTMQPESLWNVNCNSVHFHITTVLRTVLTLQLHAGHLPVSFQTFKEHL